MEGRRLLQPPCQPRSVAPLQEPHLTLQVTLMWPDRARAWLFPGPLLHTASPPGTAHPPEAGQGRAESPTPRSAVAAGLPSAGGVWVPLSSGGFQVPWTPHAVAAGDKGDPTAAQGVSSRGASCGVHAPLGVLELPLSRAWSSRTSWFAQQFAEHLHNALPGWELSWGSWWLPGPRVHSLPLLTRAPR